jgi:DNA primase
VVEGLFDLASLWQAGFTNTVALLGSHFTTRQLAQLADGRPRTVYLCLDEDANQSGQRAARWWRMRLEQAGMRAAQLQLPAGYDPNRFFSEGGSAEWFAQLLGEAGQ